MRCAVNASGWAAVCARLKEDFEEALLKSEEHIWNASSSLVPGQLERPTKVSPKLFCLHITHPPHPPPPTPPTLTPTPDEDAALEGLAEVIPNVICGNVGESRFDDVRCLLRIAAMCCAVLLCAVWGCAASLLPAHLPSPPSLCTGKS